MRTASLITALAATWATVAMAAEESPPAPGDGVAEVIAERLEVFPEIIRIDSPFDYRQILVTGVAADGARVDLTREAAYTWEGSPGEPIAAVDDHALVRPQSTGHAKLLIEAAGLSTSVDVAVGDLDSAPEVDFISRVNPMLSKLGCNAGTCHGSAKGKNGFKLSLRGYDAVWDYRSLTDDLASRRFNRAAPSQSLMLLKTSGAAPHVGGVLTSPGEPSYELIRKWIAAGAKFDPTAPRVVSIELLPNKPIVPLPGMQQQMVVLATYDNGDVRDVTAEAFVESGSIETVKTDGRSVATALRRGEAPLLARYEGAYAATTMTVMGDRTGFEWTEPPTFNFIDELVYSKLQRVKTSVAPLCSDAEFIRRVYLDLTGVPPSSDAVRAFLADERPTRQKRSELIDELIGSDEYVEYWTNKWADLLQVNRRFLGREGAAAFRDWIRRAVAENQPYDEFVRSVITASGSTAENPAASYYKILREPDAAMENTTQLFLAVRFNCNKCHDHPFERWTQAQYYELAAYFARVGRKEDPTAGLHTIGGSAVEGATPAIEVVYDQASGELLSERTGADAVPEFPYQQELVDVHSEATRRRQLAEWITSPDNQYFASSYVNRLWGYLLGVGLIEPIDDIRAGNPPTNPELLDRLESEFIASGFDPQHILRLICNSRTYQHSAESDEFNEDDEINYSHALARRLPAEVLYDGIYRSLGATPKLPEMPTGFRAAELIDAGATISFLDDFGRPPRESACECERNSGVMLGPIMKLINGPTLADAVDDPANRLAKLVDSGADDRAVIEEIFLSILNRPPTAAELELGAESLRNEALEAEYQTSQAELEAYLLGAAQRLENLEHGQGVDDLPSEVAAVLNVPRGERSEEQQSLLRSHVLESGRQYAQLKAAAERGKQQVAEKRLMGAQDLAWALLNSPAFLFNH